MFLQCSSGMHKDGPAQATLVLLASRKEEE